MKKRRMGLTKPAFINYVIPMCLLFWVSCNNHKAINTIKRDGDNPIVKTGEMREDVFKKKVVVILAGEPNMASTVINIQDFIVNGKSFIPFFSSVEKFNESTKGMVKNPKIEIDAMLFLSILKGTETLRLNPGLDDDVTFQSSELIHKYSSEIEQFKLKMKSHIEEYRNHLPPNN